MKNILLIILLLASTTLKAQTATIKEQSNAEKFSERSGTLIQREFIDVSDLKRCKIQIVKIADLIAGTKVSALRFEVEKASTYSTSTKAAHLDPDEVDGLIKSIKMILEKVIPGMPEFYTEVNFYSRSRFVAGCFSKDKTWTTFLKLDKYDSDSYIWMDKDDFTKLLTILENAKTKL